MKNILLLIFSVFATFCITEVSMRDLILPRLKVHISVPPTIFLNRGYFVNPNTGSARDQFEKRVAYYHYYAPHLRDTPVNPQAMHILTLGDSFTFGMLLPWRNTFLYHLQEDANKKFGKNRYQFLNAGLGGWGTAGYLSYLEDYGSRVSPKFVLVFLNTDDIGRSMETTSYHFSNISNPHSLQLTRSYRPCFRHPALREMITNPWIFSHLTVLQMIRYIITESYSKYHHIPGPDSSSFSVDFGNGATALKDSPQKSRAISTTENEPIIPENKGVEFQDALAIRYAEALFYMMNEWCRQHHAKLLVVTTGFDAFYPKNEHDPTKSFLKVAPAFFEKEHIAFYDTAVPFKKMVRGNRFQIPIDGHPNAFGAVAIAKVSWPWIKQKINGNQ